MLVNLLMGMAPKLVPMLMGTAKDKAIEVISEKLGITPSEESITNHLTRYPEDSVKLDQIDLERLEAQLKDVQNARAMHQQAMINDDPMVRRFIYFYAWFWACASVLYFFCVTFLQLPEGGRDFANIILGFLLGTAVATILAFFYGSSSGSKTKDNIKESRK
jgi:hypothetical protein